MLGQTVVGVTIYGFARKGVRLLGRAMLCQTVVAAIICGFVRTDQTGKLSEHIYASDQGPQLPIWVLSSPGRAYLTYRAKSFDLAFSQNRK